MAEVDKVVAVTSATVAGLLNTLDARFKAFDRGIEIVTAGQRAVEMTVQTIAANVATCTNQITEINGIKQKGEGALWLFRLIGLSVFVSFFLWVIRNWKGGGP